MRAAISHWRGECLMCAFMVTDREVTKNIDGSETCRMTFPYPITVESGDVVNITYFPYVETP